MIKRHLYIILLLLFSTTASGQNGSAFQLNHLSIQDTLLTGWKMYAGDDPQFANPFFDDSKWDAIDLSKDIQKYPQLHKAGIIWLRLHITVDSAFAKEQLAIHIVQYTASEVYLNGELLNKYGVVSADPKRVSAYLPSLQPFHVNLKPGADNVFAVRVAYERGIPYTSYITGTLPVFNLYINRQQPALNNYNAKEHQLKIYVIIFSISSGTLLILGFIYLVYFLFDRSKKVHLYYSITMLALCLNALPIEIWGADRYGSVALALWVFYFEGVALTAGMLFMVITIYQLFGYPHRFVFKILVLAGIAMCISMYAFGRIGYFIANAGFPILCLLEGCYVCVWAIKRNKKDAAIILTGVILYILFTVLSSLINTDSIAAQLLFYLSQMCFPIGMSFYLGIQSSIDNKKLRTSLNEVQLLSAKNLAHEQEKQQILFSQNELLEQQVNERTSELNQSLQELKSTQSQLIQSEKMASLGELTTGIAHEIQNPLNFINNFSDVNKELLAELNEEIEKERYNDVKEIANDVIDNEEKINHHGKRADAIVKAMLQHSRTSRGEKEPTDIDRLADEYLRLAYHGFKEKNKSFETKIETDFDSSVGQINIVPQDIGRVLLNLINNAFYAVNERRKQNLNGYEPIVSVSTTKRDDKVEIKVKDNGIGMPQKIADKIFQPFFTTKPTGQGTGLGLSLAYDIVKAHGGEIKVKTSEMQGSEFTIQLPATA
jgi:two-component system NtrC family sensor kinase